MSETAKRPDTRLRHDRERFAAWLTGIESKRMVAERYGVSRWTLTRECEAFVRDGADDPGNPPPSGFRAKTLIADAKFIDGNRLCALIALTESDRIFW